MHPRSRPVPSFLFLVTALAGCGSSITTSPATPDAAVTDAVTLLPDAVTALPDAVACPPRAELPPALACVGMTELATTANAVVGVIDTYALADLRPARDTARPTCVAEPWQDRADATVRFTAPRGGRWRFRAWGEELWSLDVRRSCTTAAGCTGFPDVHGPHASSVLSLDVQVQRGESVGLVLDGCPPGVACRYALRVERIADLACEFDFGTPPVCAGEREACIVNGCDPERFECVAVPSRAPTLTSLRVLVQDAGARTLLVGRARLGDPSALRRSATVMARWFDAAGATLAAPTYAGQVNVGLSGAFADLGRTAIPRDATRGLFWFYDSTRPEAEGAVAAAVERWTPPTVGDACGRAAVLERCGEGLRCVTAGGSDRGVCRRATVIDVTGLRAWRDDAAGALRLGVEGFGAGTQLSALAIEVLDADGVVLASAPQVAPMFSPELPSWVPFTTRVEVSNDPLAFRPSGIDRSFHVTPAMARVRVVAIDTSGRRSAPVEAAVSATTVVALGAFCDELAVSCAAGLTCAQQGGGDRPRCEPTYAARACGMSERLPTWAPPAIAGTYTVEGAAHNVGGGPRCYVGRTQRVTALEFVAPVAGRYGFALRGLRALSVGTGCEESVCELAPPGSSDVSVEVALAAGQRVPLELASDRDGTGAAGFALSVRVP